MINSVDSFSGFTVGNIKVAEAFYVDTLGLTLRDEKMGLQLELPGGSQLFIYEKPDHQPAAFTVLNFVVTNIDETMDDLATKGITFEKYDLGDDMIQDEKGVVRGLAAGMGPDIAWFKDPAGNILSVLQSS